jgi:hypothetical protein
MAQIDVYLEVSSKRVFACALDWPGWARSGKTEDDALEALAHYTERYRRVAREAGVEFPKTLDLKVVDRVTGNATTEFGAPGAVRGDDSKPFSGREAERHLALVDAAWQVLDKAVADAPQALRKGPRGGGRDRDKIVEHVLGAEGGYASKLGVKFSQPTVGDKKAITEARKAVLDGLREPKREDPKAWPPRYAARRIAWHVLDHAWEVEDRSSSS